MKPRTTTAIIIISCAAFLIGLNLYSQDDPAPGIITWEHLAFEVGHLTSLKDPELSEKIVQLGNDGWQLVDVESKTQMGNTSTMIYFFKRPK